VSYPSRSAISAFTWSRETRSQGPVHIGQIEGLGRLHHHRPPLPIELSGILWTQSGPNL
jgi:hypothetical protein